MRCNAQCNGILTTGIQIRFRRSSLVYTILDYTMYNREEVYMELTSIQDKKLFVTRRLKEIQCLNCPNNTI